MALEITVQFIGPGSPHRVSRDGLVQIAEQGGGGFPDGREPKGLAIGNIAVTGPTARFSTRGDEVQFLDGKIKLELTQKVYLVDTLTACESRYWRDHEMLHIQDNKAIVNQMKNQLIREAIAANVIWKSIFVERKWVQLSDFSEQQELLQQNIGDMFTGKQNEATNRRDAPEEYVRVERMVLQQCTQGSGGRRSSGARPTTTGRENATSVR